MSKEVIKELNHIKKRVEGKQTTPIGPITYEYNVALKQVVEMIEKRIKAIEKKTTKQS